MRRLITVAVFAVAALASIGVLAVLMARPAAEAGGRELTPKGNMTLAEAQAFQGFSLLYPGRRFEETPLTAIHRVRATPYPGESVRQNEVTFLYGTCIAATPEEGCSLPLQVQVWPACERYQALYPFEPDESLTIRGVPAAFYDRHGRLELYTGRLTVVIFGRSREQLLRAAGALRGVNSALTEKAQLPQPATGSRKGQLPCTPGED